MVDGLGVVCGARRISASARGNGLSDARVVVDNCDWPGRVGDGELSVMTARTLQ